MELHVYTFETPDGEDTSFYTQDYREAEEYARSGRLRLIDNTFEWADSELVEDYIEKDEDDDE